MEGPDKLGIGSRRMSRAIGDAGVNMRGFSAMRAGKNFVAYIGFDSSDDADRAAKALKSVGSKTATRKRAHRAEFRCQKTGRQARGKSRRQGEREGGGRQSGATPAIRLCPLLFRALLFPHSLIFLAFSPWRAGERNQSSPTCIHPPIKKIDNSPSLRRLKSGSSGNDGSGRMDGVG